MMIIYIVGIQGIPNDVIEAPKIDGANYWQRIWNLAMAGLTLTVIPVVIFYLFAQKHIIKGIGEGAVK